MKNIAQLLKYLYPSSEPLRDWIVSEDNKGQKITMWNEEKLGPQPSLEELYSHESAANDAETAKKQKEEDERTEREQVKGIISALKKGTATNAQIQKALAQLIQDNYR